MNKRMGYLDNLFKTQNLIILLLFIIGLKTNSTLYMYIGLGNINSLMTYLYYLLMITAALVVTLDLIFEKRKLNKILLKNWIILIFAIMLKLMILMIQFPGSFLPGGNNFGYFINFISITFILYILINGLDNLSIIKKSIWSLGLGLFIASVTPLILFPEMIGSRQSEIGNFTFTGGIWNVGVIGFISIGWLLIALSVNEKSTFKRIILVFSTLIIALSGLVGLSRAIAVSIVVSVIVYLIFARKIKQYLNFIIISIIVVIILTYAFSEVIDNLAYRLDGGINVQEETRTIIWKSYIANIPDYFWFGEIEGDYTKYTNWIFGPHSAPLNWFVQFGLFGLLGFVMLLLGVFKAIQFIGKTQTRIVSAPLYAWLIAYMAISFINETGFKDLSVFSAIGIIYAWGLNSYKKI